MNDTSGSLWLGDDSIGNIQVAGAPSWGTLHRTLNAGDAAMLVRLPTGTGYTYWREVPIT